MALEAHQAQIGVLDSQKNESNARAKKYEVEAQMEVERVKNDRIEAVTEGMDSNEGDAAEFDRRMAILDRHLKFKEFNLKEEESKFQRDQQSKSSEAEDKLIRKLGLVGGTDAQS